MDLPQGETWLANAVRFLIDRQRPEAANLLLACAIELSEFENWGETHVTICLTGPQAVYNIISDRSYETSKIREQINEAFSAFLPSDLRMGGITARIEMSKFDPEWRTELIELLRGTAIENQGVEFKGDIPVKL